MNNQCYHCGSGLKHPNQGYHNRIKTLRKWVYSKSLSKYEKLLMELAILLQNLLPQEQVKIKDQVLDAQLKERMTEEKYRAMYQLLTYGICLLNQHQRMYEDHHWIAEREDQLTALHLLQPKMYPQSMLDLRTRGIYQQLMEAFYPSDFTIYQASLALVISKSTLKKHIMAMENAGYIERTGGNKKQGYKYNIGTHWVWRK